MAEESRRGFLKVAGCSVLGAFGLVGCGSSATAVQGGRLQAEGASEALTAKQWAMIVDMKKCLKKEGCTACIDACNRTHNVPVIENPEEEIKWIWKEKYEHVFPTQAHSHTEDALKGQPVLALCNHCVSPPCVRVCPTQATWKRESDGIVMMDQHRCIGCRYCMVACPYGARSFNWSDPRPKIQGAVNTEYPTRTKGVVEKCTFCAERLAKGLIPACVEACEESGGGALTFGDLEDPGSRVSKILKRRHSIRRKPGLGTEPQVFYSV